MGDIRTLLTEIFAAEPEYKLAERYSRGKVNEVWANDKVAKVLNKNSGRYRVNIARRPIDAVLDRLTITDVAVADDTSGALTQRLVDEVWEPNQLDLEIPDALDKAETFGDAYLVEWPASDENGNLTGGVDVFVNDPIGMRIIYDEENPRRKKFAGRTWLNSDGYRRVTLWYPGPRVERYISIQKANKADKNPNDDQYVPYDVDGDDSPFEDLDLGLGVPVHHLRTARPYGVPVHESVFGPQNMLTKQVATMMDATDGWGFPFRYMATKSGMPGGQSDLDDGDWGEDDTSKPDVPQSPRTDPGTLARLSDVDSVGQLGPADVSNFIDPIGLTMRLSSVVSNTPLSYFDPAAASASGESKKEHEKPAVQKANKHQASFNATLRDALEYAMALLGEAVKVMITWAPTESVDDHAEVDLAQKRQDAGVPALVSLTQLGYPKEDVEEWIKNATPDDTLLEHRVTLLKEFSAAAAQLGTAVTLGVVDQATAQQLMVGFLPRSEIPESEEDSNQ